MIKLRNNIEHLTVSVLCRGNKYTCAGNVSPHEVSNVIYEQKLQETINSGWEAVRIDSWGNIDGGSGKI